MSSIDQLIPSGGIAVWNRDSGKTKGLYGNISEKKIIETVMKNKYVAGKDEKEIVALPFLSYREVFELADRLSEPPVAMVPVDPQNQTQYLAFDGSGSERISLLRAALMAGLEGDMAIKKRKDAAERVAEGNIMNKWYVNNLKIKLIFDVLDLLRYTLGVNRSGLVDLLETKEDEFPFMQWSTPPARQVMKTGIRQG